MYRYFIFRCNGNIVLYFDVFETLFGILIHLAMCMVTMFDSHNCNIILYSARLVIVYIVTYILQTLALTPKQLYQYQVFFKQLFLINLPI